MLIPCRCRTRISMTSSLVSIGCLPAGDTETIGCVTSHPATRVTFAPAFTSPLATTTLAHGEPFLLVEAIEFLAIELDALALEHQTETPIAEPPSLRCQFTQAPAQLFIARPLWRIAIGLRMQVDQATSAPLRIALLSDRPGHSSSPQAGRQKFFPSISFSVDASSIVSAKS